MAREQHDNMAPSSAATRLIAIYLPQFHPIPENDAWWGKGFTEWTNVAKARPAFAGHYQPHIPADLGFYDLRLPDVRQAQADLAREYGIYGFCYYHYWFNGKRLLGHPLDEVLRTGEPDFPFCLCWANESWTRAWDGNDKAMLVRQEYSEADDVAHIEWLVDVFQDKRYIRVGGKPIVLIYRASQLPAPERTAAIWREVARRRGIGEIFLCRVESFTEERGAPSDLGFDAAVEFQPDWGNIGTPTAELAESGHRIFDYAKFAQRQIEKPDPPYRRFPCVTPSWDNAPRRAAGALTIAHSEPASYGKWLRSAISRVSDWPEEERVVFINAWNEWAEGNHLEPDLRFGRAYLDATRHALVGDDPLTSIPAGNDDDQPVREEALPDPLAEFSMKLQGISARLNELAGGDSGQGTIEAAALQEIGVLVRVAGEIASELEARIEQFYGLVSWPDEVRKRDQALIESAREIERLTSSYSWAVTRPLRLAADELKKAHARLVRLTARIRRASNR